MKRFIRNSYLLILAFLALNCSSEKENFELPNEFEISITNVTANSATLNLTDASSSTTGVVKYNIYLNDELIQNDFESLQYVFTELEANTDYITRVEAFNSVGETVSEKAFSTNLSTPLDFEIIVTDITTNSATLNWTDASSSATAEVIYDIYIDEELVQDDLEALEYILPELNPNTEYNVRIDAINSEGQTDAQITFSTNTPPPLDFEVTVTGITVNSAILSWTDASSSLTGDVLYKIHANDVLLVEDLSELTFTLSSLDYNTLYEIEVTATNASDESTTAQTSFITDIPEGAIVLTASVTRGSDPYGVEFDYDDSNRITYIIDYFNSTSTIFHYDSDGKIILEQQLTEDGGHDFYYNYIGDDLTELHYSYATSYDDIDYYFTAVSPNYLTYEGYYNEIGYDEEYLGNYSYTFTYDELNRVISVVKERIDVVEDINTMQITYTDGNITRLTDFDGRVYDMSYDDKNNYITFVEGPSRNGHYYYDINLKNIPFLNRFLNQNNYLTIFRDGELLQDYVYEYNSYDYPVSYSVNGNITSWYIDYHIILE